MHNLKGAWNLNEILLFHKVTFSGRLKSSELMWGENKIQKNFDQAKFMYSKWNIVDVVGEIVMSASLKR
jgi:hypothetical protein